MLRLGWSTSTVPSRSSPNRMGCTIVLPTLGNDARAARRAGRPCTMIGCPALDRLASQRADRSRRVLAVGPAERAAVGQAGLGTRDADRSGSRPSRAAGRRGARSESKEPWRVALLAIAASIRCTLFRSSAPIASSRICRVSSAEHSQRERHRDPADGRQRLQRRHRDHGGDQGQEVGDDLPAEDQDLLGVLQLVPDQQGEVEQRPAGEEVQRPPRWRRPEGSRARAPGDPVKCRTAA